MLMQHSARLVASRSTRLSSRQTERTSLEIWHERLLQWVCWVFAAVALGTLALG